MLAGMLLPLARSVRLSYSATVLNTKLDRHEQLRAEARIMQV